MNNSINTNQEISIYTAKDYIGLGDALSGRRYWSLICRKELTDKLNRLEKFKNIISKEEYDTLINKAKAAINENLEALDKINKSILHYTGDVAGFRQCYCDCIELIELSNYPVTDAIKSIEKILERFASKQTDNEDTETKNAKIIELKQKLEEALKDNSVLKQAVAVLSK